MSPFYLAIEGVIGVGKTTLATMLHDIYRAELVLEVFEENPFLSQFYEDIERYAFQTQVAFLLSRYEQQQAIQARVGQRPLVSDYTFAKDRLFARLNLHGAEWATYDQLHHTLAEQVIVPDLIVYLRAEVETLMARIAQRGRPYERTMPRDYIARLALAYDEWATSYRAAPVLTIETDALNVVTQPAALAQVRAQIEAALMAQGQARPVPAGSALNGGAA